MKTKIFLILISLIILSRFIYGWYEEKLFKEKYKIVYATVIDDKVRGRGRPGDRDIFYKYSVSGKDYIGRTAYPNTAKAWAKLVQGRTFNVAYNPNDTDRSRILITRNDFAYFNLPYPDSLLWIEKLMDQY
jgi:hypothetical protein